MCCFHKRYSLGDKHSIDNSQFEDWDEVEEYLIKEEKAIVILPLYLYDHSGITISTAPFSCNWDSGQIGFIYTTEKRIKELKVELDDKKIKVNFRSKGRVAVNGIAHRHGGGGHPYAAGMLLQMPISEAIGLVLEEVFELFGERSI